MASDPIPPHRPISSTGWGTLRLLSRYQWFVFFVVSTAWLADCMDQQLFVAARGAAMAELVAPQGDAAATEALQTKFAGWSTSLFLIGWATGGLMFGIMGDKVGRTKTLFLTILLYSAFTGLSALSTGPYDFMLYRFLTGLGVGGVFAVAVALIAEEMPGAARPYVLALFQALSAVGNCTAALVVMGLASMQGAGVFKDWYVAGTEVQPWRLMFFVGLVPALIVLLIPGRMREPQKWVDAVAARRDSKQRAGSFRELLSVPLWRKHALLGLCLAFSGVVGLWGIGFFLPKLLGVALKPPLEAEAASLGLAGAEAARYVGSKMTNWVGVGQLLLNIGAFFGMLSFGMVTERVGRKPAFLFFFALAAAATALAFGTLQTRTDLFWMAPLMGFSLLSIFGGFAVYLPELFPTYLRSTGTSFCYNVGRFVAAAGPAMLAYLTTDVYADKGADAFRWAAVTMCSVFVLGMVAVCFLPETKGRPLPE